MLPDDLLKIAETQTQKHTKQCLRVCTAAGCLTAKSDQVKLALETEIEDRGFSKDCVVKGVGCMGLCSGAPLVSVEPDSVLYQKVTAEDASAIVNALGNSPVRRLECPIDIPFFQRQKKIVLENCGNIAPDCIEEYIAADGYSALNEVLHKLTPWEVVQEITHSGLRGRGGAGYPTGLKWASVAKTQEETKFVVCNADEGDPGAFMDRTVLESDPHRVLEGMAIAGFAVGATRGYIYIRAEYPLAISRLQVAIEQAEQFGFFGKHIFDTDFEFHINLRVGAGAYVCGEETALIASIQGQRGIPRPRPPYPSQHGLWGFPTLINNVETFANIPSIIRHGAKWFASIGTERSKGTKVFSLTGDIKNTGVIEVPMGISLREIVFELGGGNPHNRPIKAVQTGGPTGGCIPDQRLDTPVDYDSLTKLGSMMGSGGMIVMDESVCMVDLAKYFIGFCMSESCGQCLPCRVGTAQMYDLLTRITEGNATLEDLELLEHLSEVVKVSSLCGLGQGAPTPILSTLRYFRGEYLDHIVDHTCKANVCTIASEAVL